MPFDPSAARSGAVFSTNPTYQAAWVCYINGVETPIMGFEIQYGVWQVPGFTIHLVPDILLQRLGNEDRIPVQIFYLDYWFDPEKPEFRLLIDGEIVGWQYMSSSGQRTMSFSCLSHIHIFQQLYFFYMTNIDNIVAAQDPQVQSSGFAQSGLLYPYSLFHQGLLVNNDQVAAARPPPRGRAQTPAATPGAPEPTGPDVNPPIKAPYELMFNVVRGIVGTEVPTKRRAVPMMNFFARHIRKTRFQNRFVRLPYLEDPGELADRKGVFPIFNAARNDEALNAMQRQTSAQIGNSGPVWNVLQQLYSMVNMEIAMIPNPAVCLVSLNVAPVAEGSDGAGNAEATRPEDQDGTITGPLNADIPIVAQRTERRIVEEDAMAQEAYDLNARIRESLEAGVTPNASDLSDAGFPTTPTSAIQVDYTQILTHLQRQNGLRAGAFGPPREPPRSTEGVATATPIRLAQYFVKPQFFFGVPPHCNVIFPSMVDAWTYDEPYLTQPTRIYVNDSVMTNLLRSDGANRHFMLHALTVAFPEEADALMHNKASDDTSRNANDHHGPASLESGKNLLIWPEEFYKGPVTAKLALPSWFQMLRQFSNSQAGPATPGGGGGPNPLIPQVTPISTAPGSNGTVTIIDAAPPNGFLSRRITFQDGRRTLQGVSVGGRPDQAALLGYGTGLDPSPQYYLPLTRTGLWGPATAPATSQTGEGARRGRLTNEERAEIQRKFPQRLGQVHRLFRTFFNEAGTGISGDNDIFAAVYAAAFVVLREGGLGGRLNNWNFGNIRQRNTYATGAWYADYPEGSPSYRKPYRAYATKEEGARAFMREALKPTGIPALRGEADSCPPVLRDFLRTRMPTSAVFNAGTSGIVRPDWYYVALGYYEYYAGESYPGSTPTSQLRRMEYGLREIQNLGIERMYTAMRTAYPSLPQDTPFQRVVDQTPVASPEDLAYLNSPAGRRRVVPTRATPERPLAPRDGRQALPGTGGPGAPPGTNTPPPSTTPIAANEADQENSFQNLFRLYAQAEYLRQRYTVRQAAVQMRFNPYLVPGFPSMMFDSMRTRFHVVGYVQSVSHSASATGGGNIGTQVQLTCCRTLPEFINDVRADAERFRSRVTTAPAEIIDEIRARIQDDDKAEEFYRRLFYANGPRPINAPTAFRWMQAMGYSRGLETDEIYVDGESVSTTVERAQVADGARRAETDPNAPPAAQVPETAPTLSPGFVAARGALRDQQRRLAEADGDTPERRREIAGLERDLLENLGRSATPADVALRNQLAAARADLARAESAGAGSTIYRGAADEFRAPNAAALATPALRDRVATLQTQVRERATIIRGYDIEGVAVAATAERATEIDRQQAVAAEAAQTVRHNLDPNRELSPRENIYQEAFDQYDTAMRLASRPACSLNDYIRFWHAGMTVNDLLDRNVISGPREIFAYQEVQEQDVVAVGAGPTGERVNIRGVNTRKGGIYYDRIFTLRPGPGEGANHLSPPTEPEQGYTNPPVLAPSATHAGVSASYPQTRANWDEVLTLYREKVRSLLRPST